MPKFRVSTDEQVSVWQRVILVIDAESERELEEILNEPPLFNQAMRAGRVECVDVIDHYWETESGLNWDHETADFREIRGNE